MKKILDYINELSRKIELKQKELNYENDYERKKNLKKDLDVLQLKKQIAIMKKKIKVITS